MTTSKLDLTESLETTPNIDRYTTDKTHFEDSSTATPSYIETTTAIRLTTGVNPTTIGIYHVCGVCIIFLRSNINSRDNNNVCAVD